MMRFMVGFVAAIALAAQACGADQPAGKDAKMPETRVLLEGDVLHIGNYGSGKAPYPEDIVAAGVMRAVAQYLKVDLKTQGIFWGDYCFFAGVTGEAFRFLDLMQLSKPTPGQTLVDRYGNITQTRMYEYALEAAGLEGKVYLKGHMPEREALRQQVVESLRDRNTPVIGIGVFGPPEPFLITGYDQNGDVLLGWSHFQDEKKDDPNLSREPSGQFRLADWYPAIDGVVIITGKGAAPSQAEIYRTAIERGIKELQTTGKDNDLGTAKMEKWAEHLTDADYFAKLSLPQWAKSYTDHSITAGDLAERRALASSFAELAGRAYPQAQTDLTMAQACFQGSHDTIYEIWETVARTGPFDHDPAKYRDPARRQTMAVLVRRLAELDRRAVAYLQRALNIIDGKDAGPAIAPDPLLDGAVKLKKAQMPTTKPIWAPENIHIANAMSMLRVFLGEPFGEVNDAEKANNKLDYVLWMGYTGAAFGMLADGPENSNLPLAFDALGYDYETWASGEVAAQTGLKYRDWGWDDNLRRRIFWNLRDRHLPVLLFNCGKWPDWWLITEADHWWGFRGYGGDDGQGYRPNEPLDDPKNPLRAIDLMAQMKGKKTWTINVLVKRTTAKPAMETLYQRAIEFGAKRMQEQQMRLLDADGKEFISQQPYADWAKMLTTDALFPANDNDVLKKRRDEFFGHEVELAERRHYGAAFLELASTRLDKPELKEAANHFRAVNKLMEQVWARCGGSGSPDSYKTYADPETRKAVANLILQAGREDEAAAALLSQ